MSGKLGLEWSPSSSSLLRRALIAAAPLPPRPQVAGPGMPAGDFIIQGRQRHGVEGLVCLYGIESPGLTASLAIADEVLRALGT